MTGAPAVPRCIAGHDGRCELSSLGAFLDRSGMIGHVEVWQCKYCHHAVSYPPIPDVKFLYGDRESQDYQPDTKNGLAHTIKSVAFRAQARKLLRQIGKPGTSALDFGCGSGQFTRVLGQMMPRTTLTGCDFHDAPPPDLEGRPYLHTATVAAFPEIYDLVLASHVLEHDDDAPGLLAKIVAPAKSGATVVIEVPNVECFWSRIFGRFWDAWYLPYHRHHFSEQSLAKLVTDGGLQVEVIHGLTVPTMGRTVANLFGRRNSLPWLLVGIALHPLQWLGEKISGRPTALRLIARKP